MKIKYFKSAEDFRRWLRKAGPRWTRAKKTGRAFIRTNKGAPTWMGITRKDCGKTKLTGISFMLNHPRIEKQSGGGS
jgi:hypothetical protein